MQDPRATDPVLDRAIKGDRAAWAELLGAHGARVWALCLRFRPHEADDAYQEVWERIFGNLHHFDPQGEATFGTWVGIVAYRHLIDQHRRERTRGVVLSFDALRSKDPPQDEALAGRTREARLQAAIDRLPPQMREVVVAHHLGGVPLEVVAESEGVAVGTVKSRLHRARARLLELLEGA